MRSHILFDKDLKTLEKTMERDWRLKNGEIEIAEAIEEHDLKDWENIK